MARKLRSTVQLPSEFISSNTWDSKEASIKATGTSNVLNDFPERLCANSLPAAGRRCFCGMAWSMVVFLSRSNHISRKVLSSLIRNARLASRGEPNVTEWRGLVSVPHAKEQRYEYVIVPCTKLSQTLPHAVSPILAPGVPHDCVQGASLFISCCKKKCTLRPFAQRRP